MTENSLFTLLALVISASAMVVLGHIAEPLGLVDRPDQDLKDHGRIVPIVGGLAVFATLNVVMAGATIFDPALFWAGLGLLLVGLYDDVRTLPPLLRLVAAAAAGAAAEEADEGSGAGEAAGVAAGAAEPCAATYASTSFRVIRPSRPVPVT